MGSRSNDQLLERGLEKWRQRRLQAIEDQMIELNGDLRSAKNGLAIAHRNPGEVRQDIIEYHWDKLNRSVTELELSERRHQELKEMDLAHLVIEYKRKRKEKFGWPYQYC